MHPCSNTKHGEQQLLFIHGSQLQTQRLSFNQDDCHKLSVGGANDSFSKNQTRL